jgi:acyl-CoA thioester hydrolase
MSKPSFELPTGLVHRHQYRIKSSDINHANHLAAVSVLPIALRAQSVLLDAIGLDPENTDLGLMMASSQIDYISEAHLDDLLDVDMYVLDVDSKSFDLIYQLRNVDSDFEIARVKTRMLFYDYLMRKVVEIPKDFTQGLNNLSAEPIWNTTTHQQFRLV